MKYKSNYSWINTHKNLTFQVARLYEPWNRMPDGSMPPDKIAAWNAGMANIQSILKDAEQDNKCVRAVGGGWSLSEVQKTTDYFVNTQPLNLVFAGIDPGWAAAGKDAATLVLAQCGTGVMELNKKLFAKGLALPTTGASDGQTIMGAISTGTHGSAINVGSMQDYAVGLHIVTGSSEHYWVEGNEQYVTPKFLATMPGITRINDDEVFNAAVVSFGSFGIVHGVLLQVEPAYALEVNQKYAAWDLVKQCIDGPGNYNVVGLPPDPFYFRAVLNPFKLDEVVVATMHKKPGSTAPDHKGIEVQYGIGADVLTLFGKIASAIPAAVPNFMGFFQTFVKTTFPEIPGLIDYPGNIFGGGQTTIEGKALSTELGVDASNTAAVMDIVLDELNKTPLPGLITIRYVKKSKATLAFTKFGTTCTIEIPSSLSQSTQKFYDGLWQRLEFANIDFTFHWGQCNNLNKERVRKKYGDDAVNSWINARAKILKTPQQRKMFSNDFLHTCGLDDGPTSLPV